MRRKKGKKGWMTIKMDLEKAYNRLKRWFTRDTNEDVGFPLEIVNLAWHCISTLSMKIYPTKW